MCSNPTFFLPITLSFFLPFFSPLFYTSFPPSLFHPLFGAPLISSSPAFLLFFVLLFFCHSISSSSFFFSSSFLPLFPFCCISFLSFLPLFYSPGSFLLSPSSLFLVVFFFSFLPFNHFFPYLFHLFAKGVAIKQRLSNSNKRFVHTILPPPCPTACPVPQLSLQYPGENTG